VNGERIRALRHAREIVDDMRWRGMAVPPVYASMADEFSALVRSGEYAAWLAGSTKPRGHAT
jgi:ribulose 1,5-bisphosphate synthetase/thiazole synthase